MKSASSAGDDTGVEGFWASYEVKTARFNIFISKAFIKSNHLYYFSNTTFLLILEAFIRFKYVILPFISDVSLP